MRLNPKTKEQLELLKTLTLDERAKARMRDGLDAYADLHAIAAPIASRAAVRSPFSIPSMFSRAGSGVLAFAVLLLIGGSGVAYAAEGSVPGNALYKVKVAVIEPVQGALITSPAGQATWHASLASRRLEEATKLAVANKLDTETQVYLQEKFNAEVDSSDQAANILSSAGKTEVALDVRSDLEAQITAHAQILAIVTNHLEETASTTATSTTLIGTKTLLASVQQRQWEVVSARLALEDAAQNHGAAATVATLARAEIDTKAANTRIRAKAGTAIAPVAERIGDANTAVTMAAQAAPNGQAVAIDAHAAERDSEVASILLKHAALLRAMAPIATTSTTTMATSTAPIATTTEAKVD